MPYPTTPEEWDEWRRRQFGEPEEGADPLGDQIPTGPIDETPGTEDIDRVPGRDLPQGDPAEDDGGGSSSGGTGGHSGGSTGAGGDTTTTSSDGGGPDGGSDGGGGDGFEWGQIPEFDFDMPDPFERGEFDPGPMPTAPPPPPPAPDFGVNIQEPQTQAEWNRPDDPAAAPDFMGVAGDYLDEEGTQFQRPEGPGEAPDYMGIAGDVPDYETPENAFLGENLYPELEEYARNWLQNPNRYHSELAEATRTEGEARRAAEQEEQRRGIEEWAAGRGMTASTVEGGLMVDLADKMDRTQNEEELELLKMLAEAETTDRESAGRYGTHVADLGRTLGQTRIAEAQGAADIAGRKADRMLQAAGMQDESEMARSDFDLRVEQSAAEQGIREAGLMLDAAQMQEQANQFRAEFQRAVENDGFDAAYRNAQLEQQRHMRQAELDLQSAIAGDDAAMRRVRHELDVMNAMDAAFLSRQDLQLRSDQIDQRSWEIMGNWQMRGEELDAEHARWMAEIEQRRDEYDRDDQFRREELDEKRRQHDDQIDSRIGS